MVVTTVVVPPPAATARARLVAGATGAAAAVLARRVAAIRAPAGCVGRDVAELERHLVAAVLALGEADRGDALRARGGERGRDRHRVAGGVVDERDLPGRVDDRQHEGPVVEPLPAAELPPTHPLEERGRGGPGVAEEALLAPPERGGDVEVAHDPIPQRLVGILALDDDVAASPSGGRGRLGGLADVHARP